jgi:hypothetical protein
MQNKKFLRAGLLTLLLLSACVISWERYWRSKGFPVAYNDDNALWAHKRSQVYRPASSSTVFIGSSRIKFDLDIPTWERITGEKAIQLSMVGTSPRPLLQDLADDQNFKGKLIIDVTEPLFFMRNRGRAEKSAHEGIGYYKKQTPSQRVSGVLDRTLESTFVFLEENAFGLNALLSDMQVPNRKGVFSFPVFPKEFEMMSEDRQAFMTDRFLKDTALQNWQTRNWTMLGALDRTPAIKGDSLTAVFKEIKTAIDKIKARGGKVMFVRTPSSGGYIETENVVFPRRDYWDPMLAYTQTDGIHFTDYPETSHFICPEWSHLATPDVLIYTKELIKELDQKGWFSKPIVVN